jgi:hypothetical protein
MRLTVNQLRRIIKEEVSRMLRENTEDVSSEEAKNNLPVSELKLQAGEIQDNLSGDSLQQFNKLLMDLFDHKTYEWNWDVIGEIDKMNKDLKLQEIGDFTDALKDEESMHQEAKEYSDYQQETGFNESHLRRKLRRR